eukprot:3929082-Pyramimonas_sp.AAC.1
MWLSPSRRPHSIITFARVARNSIINVPEIVFWMDSGLRGCNSHVDRCVEVPRTASWQDSGSSRRNIQ